MERPNSPPSTPSSPDLAESDTKLSRKREREVSLEPATTPKASADPESVTREPKEARTPAKKNRIRLDTTEEEEESQSQSRFSSESPPLSVSPPQEMKIQVRQISQGVEDISWQNMKSGERGQDREDDFDIPVSKIDGEAETLSVCDGETQDKDMHAASVDAEPSATGSDNDGGDKSLKRKYPERGTSQGPPENGEAVKSSSEPLKRPRDDADKDDNPRETKRPSPPPEGESSTAKSPPTATPKLSGFMAYASTSSPFAAVKGKSIFGSKKATASSSAAKHPPPPSIPSASTSTGPSIAEAPAPVSVSPAKRSGFEAFASSSSPFASATRSKSPVLGGSKLNRNKSPPRRSNSVNTNPFSQYAGGVQGFAIPAPKRARAGSPTNSSRSSLERNATVNVFGSNESLENDAEDETEDREVTFGERLRAGRDEDDESKRDFNHAQPLLTEQDVMTGEEDEDTVHQARGKLFHLADGNWKERGTGTIKLNVRRSDGSGARLVMRKDAVYALLLNVTLFPGMSCGLAQDPRYLRFSAIEDGSTVHYNLRCANAKVAQDLLDEIKMNIPETS